MEAITSRTGSAHVSSSQFRSIFESVVGEESYIANIDNKLSAEIGTGNKILIRSGVLVHHGNIVRVPVNTYDEVSYESGAQGVFRTDLIVARHTINGDGTESDGWFILKGAPSASEGGAVAPDYTHGNMQEGDSVDECPLYELHFDGLNITDIVPLVEVVSGISGNNIKKCVVTRNVNFTASVSANNGVNKNINLPAVEGYEPIGIIGWYLTGDHASMLTLPNAYIEGSVAKLYIRNSFSGTATITGTSYVQILYARV